MSLQVVLLHWLQVYFTDSQNRGGNGETGMTEGGISYESEGKRLFYFTNSTYFTDSQNRGEAGVAGKKGLRMGGNYMSQKFTG